MLSILCCCCGLPALGGVLVRCGRTLKRRRTRRSLNIPKKPSTPLSPTPRPEAVAVNAILPAPRTFDLVEMGLGSVLAKLPDSSSSENEEPTEETRFCTVNLEASSSADVLAELPDSSSLEDEGPENEGPTEITGFCTVKLDATSSDESSLFGECLSTIEEEEEYEDLK